MDAIGDPHVRSVVVMSAAQIGKTDAFILNPLGYYMDYAPCPVMCMQPTLDMGQTLSKDRIAPMIRDTPRLTGLVDTKSRYAGNTVMKKNFPGGHITIVGANSRRALPAAPSKCCWRTRSTATPRAQEQRATLLIWQRNARRPFGITRPSWSARPPSRETAALRTPTYFLHKKNGTCLARNVGHTSRSFGRNVKFDKDDLDKGIGYVCRECGCVSNEYRWKEQGKYGKYVAANPGA